MAQNNSQNEVQNIKNIRQKEFKFIDRNAEELEKHGYRELDQIGIGSYGKVFRAKSDKHREAVAIKVIDLNRFPDVFRKKFLNVELEAIRKLEEHENLVKFHDIIEDRDDRMIFIVMELYPNGDVFEYIINHYNVPEREASLWFRQLINGVEHIHNSGYAHRDLKCENLLLDSKYNIKIIDFGFCCQIRYQNLIIEEEDKILSSSIQEIPSQTYCGSVLYASPELLNEHPYYPTINDIWSCGIILYLMLFGSFPKEGNELDQFLRQDRHSVEVPDTPKVSNECKQLIENILIDQKYRHDIKQIKDSLWFKRDWEPIDQNICIQEYFESLNIRRQETIGFEENELSDESNTYY